jgi:hypothetical protein
VARAELELGEEPHGDRCAHSSASSSRRVRARQRWMIVSS